MWQGIKLALDLALPKFTPSCLEINHTLVTEKNKVANEFNHFFNSIATKIDAKIVKTKFQFHESLKNPNEKTFHQQKNWKTILSS